MMPDVDGVRLLEQVLEEHDGALPVPILVVTGSPDGRPALPRPARRRRRVHQALRPRRPDRPPAGPPGLTATTTKGRAMRHFLSADDVSAGQLRSLLDRADELKAERAARPARGRVSRHGQLRGRSVALIFEKPSLRTRASFEVGVHELGGKALPMWDAEVGWAAARRWRTPARCSAATSTPS
jgi:hypothetical protein